jgi:hypothetical protein
MHALISDGLEEAGSVRSQCMHGLDGERVNVCIHSVAGVRLAKGYLSKFRGEISYFKPCLGIRESPKTQGINGRREYYSTLLLRLNYQLMSV